MLVGLFLLSSWVYLLWLVRSLRRGLDDLAADVRHAADRLSGTLLEQQGELICRVGRAVHHLERMEQTLGAISPPDMHVSSITAENLVVRPSVVEGTARHGGAGR